MSALVPRATSLLQPVKLLDRFPVQHDHQFSVHIFRRLVRRLRSISQRLDEHFVELKKFLCIGKSSNSGGKPLENRFGPGPYSPRRELFPG